MSRKQKGADLTRKTQALRLVLLRIPVPLKYLAGDPKSNLAAVQLDLHL